MSAVRSLSGDRWTPFEPGVPPTWAVIDFGLAFESLSINSKKVAASTYTSTGLLPVIDQGEQFIGGYTDDVTLSIDPGVGLLVFGDHTRRFKLAQVPFAPGADGIKVLRPRFTSPAYAYYASHSVRLPDRGYSRHYSFLVRTRFPIAPLREQDRIVSRIEELFSEIDAGERGMDRVRKLVERYRQSVFKAAITGELTRAWRQAHGVEVHAANDLPRGWASTSLGDMCTKVTSGSRDWKSYYGRGDSVFIMAQNVRRGRLDFSVVQIVDPPLGSKDADRSQVEESDLLVTIVGANTGDVCRVDRPLPKHYVCQSVALIRLTDARLSAYVELFLTADDGGQAQFAETIYGAGRPHLSFDQLKAVVIPLPPLEEQNLIVDAVVRAESELQATVQAISAAKQRSIALRQSVLKAAFSGQLVPQDPTDEPASALLARVSAQTNDTPPAPRRRGRRPAGTLP